MHNDVIMRITNYYRILNRLKGLGLEKVFAHNLGDAAGVSAALVRKDFSLLSIKGQKRGGYETEELITTLGNILGKGSEQNVIIVGCGHIGKALIKYRGFEIDKMKIVAGFDTDTSLQDYSSSTPIYPMSELKNKIDELDTNVAIIAVPDTATNDVYKRLIDCGIRGFLNFSPITLKNIKLVDGTTTFVRNVNIALELEHIFYHLNHQ